MDHISVCWHHISAAHSILRGTTGLKSPTIFARLAHQSVLIPLQLYQRTCMGYKRCPSPADFSAVSFVRNYKLGFAQRKYRTVGGLHHNAGFLRVKCEWFEPNEK